MRSMRKGSSGFTLAEVVAALVILGILLTAMLRLYAYAAWANHDARCRIQAQYLCKEIMEYIRVHPQGLRTGVFSSLQEIYPESSFALPDGFKARIEISPWGGDAGLWVARTAVGWQTGAGEMQVQLTTLAGGEWHNGAR